MNFRVFVYLLVIILFYFKFQKEGKISISFSYFLWNNLYFMKFDPFPLKNKANLERKVCLHKSLFKGHDDWCIHMSYICLSVHLSGINSSGSFWKKPDIFHQLLVFSQYSQQNQAMLAQVLRTLVFKFTTSLTLRTWWCGRDN